MSKTKRAILAAASALVLAGSARTLLEFGGDFGEIFAIVVLFPGMAILFLSRGVHGNWAGFPSESVMVGVPALGWFFIIYFTFGLMVRKNSSHSPNLQR